MRSKEVIYEFTKWLIRETEEQSVLWNKCQMKNILEINRRYWLIVDNQPYACHIVVWPANVFCHRTQLGRSLNARINSIGTAKKKNLVISNLKINEAMIAKMLSLAVSNGRRSTEAIQQSGWNFSRPWTT